MMHQYQNTWRPMSQRKCEPSWGNTASRVLLFECDNHCVGYSGSHSISLSLCRVIAILSQVFGHLLAMSHSYCHMHGMPHSKVLNGFKG